MQSKKAKSSRIFVITRQKSIKRKKTIRQLSPTSSIDESIMLQFIERRYPAPIINLFNTSTSADKIKLYTILSTNTLKIKQKVEQIKHIFNKTPLISDDEQIRMFNGIDHICSINLDRSVERRKHMENCLKAFQSIRISGIDGKIEPVLSYIPTKTTLSPLNIACTLSHIKAISYLSTLDGQYFMICEDDITLKNLKLMKNDLATIIKNAPANFDILKIHKTYYKPLDDLYTYLPRWIPSAVCYIITKSAVRKFMSTVARYQDGKFTFIKKKLAIAEEYIYPSMNTCIYKYNVVSCLNKTSTIHPSDLPGHRETSDVQLSFIIHDLITTQ